MKRTEKIKEDTVGFSHPVANTSITINENGQVMILAGEHAGIIVDPESGIINIYGSEVRLWSDELLYNGKQVNIIEEPNFGGKIRSGKLLRKLEEKKNERR